MSGLAATCLAHPHKRVKRGRGICSLFHGYWSRTCLVRTNRQQISLEFPKTFKTIAQLAPHAGRKPRGGDWAMLYAATALLAFQSIGELIADAAGLPVPGVVIGMLLLLVTLGWWARNTDPHSVLLRPLSQIAKALHDHFGLLFVPAGAGVVDKFDRLA